MLMFVCLLVCVFDPQGFSCAVHKLHLCQPCNCMFCTHNVLPRPLQYRIGQLYMIARHSAEESRGSGDGVETVVNEPCTDDRHGNGFYTEKRIYLTR